LNKNVGALFASLTKGYLLFKIIVGVAFNNIWFQQNEAPSRFGINVHQFLNYTFLGKWIDRRGQLNSHLDFLIWIH